MSKFSAIRAILPMAFAVLAAPAVYAADCETWIAKLVSVEGVVDVRRFETPRWSSAALGQTYCHGDQIRVGDNARASVELSNDTVLRLDQRSTLLLPEPTRDEFSFVNLVKGALHLISRVRTSLEIRTPFVNAGLEGTEFVVRVLEDEAFVAVIEGRVAVSNAHGRISLVAGQSASGTKDAAPVLRLDLKPEDAVQWAVYYPLITDPDAPGVAADIGAAQRLLFVGRVDEARAQIETVLATAPDSAAALAIASIAELAQNDQPAALDLATRAVQAAPASAMALLALSFAQQGGFELEAATASVERAIAAEPDNAIAWSRLAELRSSRGDRHAALQAAERAVALNPDLSRTQVVLGFAQLIRFDTAAARAAFNRAIELDSADPLARLGLGLAKIRDGELADGRREMEIAVSLDPANALVRSYLGKAYFEEKRNDLAGAELELAKQLDLRDPTPWLYDAFRKQAQNDPIGALADLQRSSELNENRGVFRSRLLLDQDLATRRISTGRVYSDLGMDQLVLSHAALSLMSDPAGAEAHRLLSDAYRGLRRYNTARTSELLQAQLYHPFSIGPVQPRLAVADLAVLQGAGSAAPSFNDYTTLLVSNGVRGFGALEIGDNSTVGEEAVLYGVDGRLSYSLGQYLYDTDGYRANGDLSHDIYNAMASYLVSPQLTVQSEVFVQESETGDLLQQFFVAPTESLRRTIDRKMVRLGLLYRPTARDQIVGSVVNVSSEEGLSERETVLTAILDYKRVVDTDATTAELQYIARRDRLNWVVGGTYIDVDREDFDRTITSIDLGFTIIPISTVDELFDFPARHKSLYAYATFALPDYRLDLLLGLSFEHLRSTVRDAEKVNPKLGLIWSPGPQTKLRAAWYKTLKKPFAADRLLEPAQVVGFSQLFDDADGTSTSNWGVGIDRRFAGGVHTGVEYLKRDSEEPDYDTLTAISANRDKAEQYAGAYLHWLPGRYWALSAEYLYEDVEQPFYQRDTETHRLPFSIRLFEPRGLFGEWKATYVKQNVEQNLSGAPVSGSDDFWVHDVAVGYRFPNRRGRVVLGIRNVFDNGFRFEDINFSRNKPLNPLFQPDRLVYGQLSVSLGR